jgi:hypothetical protein
MPTHTRRTARKDCLFVIYEWQSSEEGQTYVGLTRKTEGSILGSVVARWKKHESRAQHEPEKDWPLYEHLRNGGARVGWRLVVLEVVRGRAEAYARERDVVKERRPTLNLQYCDAATPQRAAQERQ